MTQLERRDEERPLTGEAPFHLHESFYSRTDTRGVIVSANYVFRRVTHYEWDELIGAPHKVIRHPDMPKAVFWLLWDTIKRGEPIGAYVKNRAKDGLFYWVFAVVVPCPGGFLSARMKPSSKLLPVVQSIYQDLRKQELAGGVNAETSAQNLLSRLQEEGYETYTHFYSDALTEELLSRDQNLGNAPDSAIAGMRAALDRAQALKRETESLVSEFITMQTTPLNMRLIAARLEPTGGPLSALSKNYSEMSREISDWFEANIVGENNNFNTINDSIRESQFIEGMSRILLQCADQLSEESRKLGMFDIDEERNILNSLESTYRDQSAEGLARVRIEARRITEACEKMERLLLGLGTARVLCKIESARLNEGGDSLDGVVDQLNHFQTMIKERLEKISDHSIDILARTGTPRGSRSSRFDQPSSLSLTPASAKVAMPE